MRHIALSLLLLLVGVKVRSLTPQQYCELLESKQKNSFELLNISDYALIKYCRHGQFCVAIAVGDRETSSNATSKTFEKFIEEKGSGTGERYEDLRFVSDNSKKCRN